MAMFLIFSIICSIIFGYAIYRHSKKSKSSEAKEVQPQKNIVELGKNVSRDIGYIIIGVDTKKYFVEIYRFRYFEGISYNEDEPSIFYYSEDANLLSGNEREEAEESFKILYKENFEKMAKLRQSKIEAAKEKQIKEFKNKFISHDEKAVKDILE